MKIIDVHSHWGTRRGYPLQTEEELAQQRATWNSEPRYHTEAEMAAYFRDSGVRAILDLGYAKYRPLEEMRALHDYAFETEARPSRRHPRPLDPHRPAARRPRRRASELRRCIDKRHRLPRLRRLGLAVAARRAIPTTSPTTTCASRPAFRC